MSDIQANQFSNFFIRPLEDNKIFDGMIINNEILLDWKNDPKKQYLNHFDLIVSPVKEIYREYRLFVVNHQIITGSLYKVAGKMQISKTIESEIIDYVEKIIKKWTPIESFVIDIALTKNGLKIIEFNNINSSSFYASDVKKYVLAIQNEYA